jgi:hypothetical protein
MKALQYDPENKVVIRISEDLAIKYYENSNIDETLRVFNGIRNIV